MSAGSKKNKVAMHIWLTWQWNTLSVSPHDSQEGLPLLTPADSSLSDGEVHSRVGQTEPKSRVSDCSFGLALGIHQLDAAHRFPTTANYTRIIIYACR